MDLTDVFRRFKRNAGIMVGSRVTFGLVNLGTTVLVARGFGLTELGIVLLLQSYARVFSEIVKFQSWQAVLSFGALLEERRDWPGFRRLVGLTLSIDLASFALAIGASILLIPWARHWFEWPEEVAELAPLYMLSIVFITHATPNGVLRLFDRIDVVALQFALNAILRFAGVGLVWFAAGGAVEIAVAWFAASVISGSLVYGVTFLELRKRKLMPILTHRARKAGAEFEGIWRFLWMTNFASAAPLVVNYGTVLLVGAQLGPASAAIFEIARQFATALARPARLLGPLLFPEFARLAAQNDWVTLRKILKKQLVLTGNVLLALAIVVYIALPFAVDFLFGSEVLSEIWLFRLLIAGALLRILGFALEPAFLSASKSGTLLLIQLVATLAFVVIAYPWLRSIGLVAIGWGMLAFNVVYLLLLLLIGRRLLVKRVRRARARFTAGPEVGKTADQAAERPDTV